MPGFLSRAALAIVLLLVCAGLLRAQNVTVGNLPANLNFGFNPGVITAVDLASPASGAGSLTTATFVYSLAPCPAAVKIKFFRPSGTTLIFLGERGSFDVTSNTQTVPLSPAVPVAAGDLIGIARVSDCGSPVGQTPGAAAGFIAFVADVVSNISVSAGTAFGNATLAVQATGPATSSQAGAVAAVIPVVISGPGAPPSFFRTSIQLTDSSNAAVSGRFVFHPSGASGTQNDPSLSYFLAPGQTQFIFDFLPSIGQGGIGSVDVVPASGSAAPVTVVRVFNDAGTEGTTGFTEDSLRVAEALSAGDHAVLIAPSDSTLFRFNIGVRTLGAGAAFTVTVRDSAASVTRTVTKTFPPNFFTQSDAASFLGVALGPSSTITIDVTSGNVIVYGATADNRTNDSSVQVLRKTF